MKHKYTKGKCRSLIAATREIGLEVNANKTKYMVMSRDQNAGRIHSVRIDNSIIPCRIFCLLGCYLKI